MVRTEVTKRNYTHRVWDVKNNRRLEKRIPQKTNKTKSGFDTGGKVWMVISTEENGKIQEDKPKKNDKMSPSHSSVFVMTKERYRINTGILCINTQNVSFTTRK